MNIHDKLDALALRQGPVRMILHKGHPNAFWCDYRKLWLENDATFRKRVLADLEKDES